MKTNCTECTRYAELDKAEAPVFEVDEINQETGLCWGVCDMERENAEAEQEEYDYLASDC